MSYEFSVDPNLSAIIREGAQAERNRRNEIDATRPIGGAIERALMALEAEAAARGEALREELTRFIVAARSELGSIREVAIETVDAWERNDLATAVNGAVKLRTIARQL